jgi:hypothetical protein
MGRSPGRKRAVRMRKKAGGTPEARGRAYKAKRHRRLKQQAELVEQVRAAWAVQRVPRTSKPQSTRGHPPERAHR